MRDPLFIEPPRVELLQGLARGSLKQNLPRAIRLWVWLRFLYGEEGLQTAFPDEFSFADWRTTFFTDTHPANEGIPPQHDRHCRCAKTTTEWLFTPQAGISQAEWCQTLQQQDALPNNIEDILQARLFGVTRRSLYEDLRILTKLGWVQRKRQKYRLVEEFPTSAWQVKLSTSAIVHPDLAAIADHLSQQINGKQRFFLHVDYVVPHDAIDRVDNWQAQLRQIWETHPIPPLLVTYTSPRVHKDFQCILYPVCIYYVQRATYLCAWGEVPNERSDVMDWRNYRLDRIQQIEGLNWEDPRVPQPMRQAFDKKTLPVPEWIQERMAEAWGFDFYQPDALLLLRFDRDFHAGYVRDTVRHETFKQVNYTQVQRLIQQNVCEPEQQQALLQLWQARSPQDAYYTARYRQGDLNVLLRLRAWRPRMEVILPWSLRQQMAAEVAQEQQLYAENNGIKL
ncbi:TIGR03985 family CRISPR-associated protein [Desertifilum sp. FACHB-1129]|uniref:CRISPR-associated protein n=1 Tax=Desertifilum tharense IPPAS B-1220 TaxID=1781255 RepID=A0A1E5QRI2_9CYAN|nr:MULTISPECIES: TIGR03985 family CRISPR-associated protein [Desertifilum]MDA0212126.1 TIGR03985 family CRISPR-associated protein [Cyanobacteria bacterium FC1]MBD2313182.1 TIGR03985 family CRISPR-associated protein [Desertifilum sp. FACHB-1129]MBD2323555.1 TIGR03985 family CRISPR-associated protein [Desertifilum sp. FACHB-866]MBD2334084.1 TIGR03985 family CRISPR-associated protein [Desertifilum sp. FACHB-868]OEJ77241.1 CRISPR-associated protein [Desertifilum tharense IPPAS B-1220]